MQDIETTETGTDPLKLDEQICFPLYAAANLLNRMYRPILEQFGLTYPQYLVLLVLWQEEPQTVSSIGTELYLDSGTLTPLLKRMEAAGLVTRERDSKDERRVIVRLTDDGRALRERAEAVPAMVAERTNLSEDDLTELKEAARTFVDALATKKPRIDTDPN